MKTVLIAVAKNENKYLNDWIAWHRKLGFSHILIYDNGRKWGLEIV